VGGFGGAAAKTTHNILDGGDATLTTATLTKKVMNHLLSLSSLRNRYFILRHGRSLANDQDLIVSHPDDGVPHFGLTEEGRRQVASGVADAIRKHRLDETTIIVTSDFARTRETAEIAGSLLGTPEIILTPKLRERFFGSWDKQHNSHYQNVWDDDAVDGHHKHHNVESTHEVLTRTTSLIVELEQRYSDRNILLVSHGDALQILQTAFERVDSSQHRRLPHLETGEIRRLELN
jgi:broad specificity phosphatase PhoE